MKRKLALGAVIAICLSLLAYGSAAFFTAEDTAHNIITTCNINIELHEWADDEKTTPFPTDGVDGVMPGTRVTKIAEVKNTGSGAAYVRVAVEKAVILADGTAGDSSPVTINFNEADWTEKDGFYYYNNALKPNETTQALFTEISFDINMDNIYQNSKALVDVTAYGVQAANNGSSALEAGGWPATE